MLFPKIFILNILLYNRDFKGCEMVFSPGRQEFYLLEISKYKHQLQHALVFHERTTRPLFAPRKYESNKIKEIYIVSKLQT